MIIFNYFFDVEEVALKLRLVEFQEDGGGRKQKTRHECKAKFLKVNVKILLVYWQLQYPANLVSIAFGKCLLKQAGK